MYILHLRTHALHYKCRQFHSQTDISRNNVHFMRKLTFPHYIVKVCKRNYSELLKEISFQKHFIFRNLAIKPTFCIFATRYRVLTNE